MRGARDTGGLLSGRTTPVVACWEDGEEAYSSSTFVLEGLSPRERSIAVGTAARDRDL
jgi:hypothetical protein